MPIPSTVADLNATAALNSPTGSESPTQGDDFIRAHASIIRQVSDTAASTHTSFLTTLLTSAGSTFVGYIEAGAGAVLRTLQAKLRDTVSVKDFGAVGDGVADDTAAFIAALAAALNVYVPPGTYKITAALTLSSGQVLRGGGRNVSNLMHTFNGDMLILGSMSVVVDLGVRGQGATYTGRGFVAPTTTPAWNIDRCNVTDWQDYCIEYVGGQAGSQSTVQDCEIWRTVLSSPAIKLPDDGLSAAPRHFFNIQTSGGVLMDTGSCQNAVIVGCFLNNMIFGAASKKVIVSGCRIATVGADLVINGTQHVLSGCVVAGNIVMGATADGCVAVGNVGAAGAVLNAGALRCTVRSNQLVTNTTDNSGSGTNSVDISPVVYTPVLSAATTPPVLGNGSIVGTYSRDGQDVTARISLTVGSTTTLGSGELRFGLPFTVGATGTTPMFGDVLALRSGVAFRVGVAVAQPGNAFASIYFDLQSNAASATIPYAWTTDDYMQLSISYPTL